MFKLQMTPAAMMKRLPLLCLCLLTRSGATFADEHGSGVVRVVVEEGSDAILPCSLSNKENAEEKLFDWKKDGQKEVFFYDGGIHYNNGRPGQDRQFKGRISHFQDELKYGNASIIISKTKMTDSGNYTCDFPRLQPRRIFNIQFVVAVAAQKPSVTAIDQTEDGVLLQCEVRGASPKPTVEWQDSAGNILPAEEPQVSERGGSYDIILQTTVNTTDRFTCVVTQDEISHQIFAEIYVQVDGHCELGLCLGNRANAPRLKAPRLRFYYQHLMKQCRPQLPPLAMALPSCVPWSLTSQQRCDPTW